MLIGVLESNDQKVLFAGQISPKPQLFETTAQRAYLENDIEARIIVVIVEGTVETLQPWNKYRKQLLLPAWVTHIQSAHSLYHKIANHVRILIR